MRRWRRSSWRCARATISWPFTTGNRHTTITRASKLVSTVTGFAVQTNKAIVGRQCLRP